MDWITSDPQILGGKPIVRGTRLSVQFILELLAGGGSLDDIATRYGVAREGIEAAVAYAAEHLAVDTDDATWLDDLVDAGQPRSRIEIYRDSTGQFRWHVRTSEGRIVAVSSESYATKADCLRIAEQLRAARLVEAAA